MRFVHLSSSNTQGQKLFTAIDDSGYAGTVWIGPSADGTQTEFSVILLEPAMGS